MNYGAIIKRAWHITWRYRALWLLGLFAGVSGCRGGSSPGSSGSGREFSRGDMRWWDGVSPERFADSMVRYVPLLIAAGLLVFGLWLAWTLLGVAARGGLIVAVNGVEDGHDPDLGVAWRAGFGRFWPLVGLGILLQLPLAVGVLLLVAGVLLPVVPAIMSGSDLSGAMIAPICGTLAIGIPLLVVGGFVLDILYLLALRYLMLGGQGVFESARNAWRFLRVRAKDSLLAYIIGGAINAVSALVLVIPIVIVLVPIVLAGVAAAHSEAWTALAGVVGAGLAFVVLMAWLYGAIMATFSSAFWTLFFRAELGMSPALLSAPKPPPQWGPPVQGQHYQPAVDQPVAPQPAAPQPVEPQPLEDEPVVGSSPSEGTPPDA